MAQPTSYNRVASFTNIQAIAPSTPLPGTTVDAEFNAVKVTSDATLANLALIQRDDGQLANESVGTDQLSTELSVGINTWEPWVTATDYAVNDTVLHTAAVYRCAIAHTAGTFATDLTAVKWTLIINLAALTLATAANIANTPAGSIAATTVQAAIDELASEKAATSHTHPSSAITDSTAAGRSMLSAATAAAQRTLLSLGALALEDTIPVTDIDAEIAFSGIIEPSALTSDQNDWAPTGIATCSTVRMSASAAVNLTGLLAPAADGALVVLENVGTTYALTLSPSSASSAAANRFLIQRPLVIGPNQSVALRYDEDATTPRWRLFDRAGNLGRGHIFGLTCSNGSDAVSDINVAVGEARGERNLLDLVLTTAMGKQLDADFTAGGTTAVPLGGRYVSSVNTPAIANTTYHVHLIGKADGTVDVMFYTGIDPTSVLPTGYIDYRRIGSILREGGSVTGFNQYGDVFRRTNLGADVSAANPGTSAVTRTLSVPAGIVVLAEVIAAIVQIGTGGTPAGFISSLVQTDSAASVSNGNVGGLNSSFAAISPISVATNTSRQIRSRLSYSDANTTLSIGTIGWIDSRGKDA